MEEQKTINDAVLGELVYTELTSSWRGKIEDSGIRVSINSIPSTESNIEKIKRFIEWFPDNNEYLIKKLVYELFNHDIVQGEQFIENVFGLTEEESEKEHRLLESKVGEAIRIKDIRSRDDNLVIGITTGRYTGDHVIDATLSDKYEILTMSK